MQFIDLKAQYLSVKERIDGRIAKVLDHGAYIMGPEVHELEEKLAEYVGVKHCISCANGTDALQLALMAMGIGPGDAVYTTSFTFFATGEAISIVGATPIFVDIDPDTYNISPESLLAAIKDKTLAEGLTPKAIIAVDLFGQPANYPVLEQMAKEHSLYLIEDAAQGFGGSIEGKRACSFGDIATTSFFPAKPLGCYGDGGALFTDNDEFAEILKSLRVHGKGADKYDNVRIGMNSRLDTIQAAILLEKLDIFHWEIEQRNLIAERYTNGLRDKFKTPSVPDGYLSSWAQYTLFLDRNLEREEFQGQLRALEVPTMVYYPIPLHRQLAFSKLARYKDIGFSENCASNVVSLPMHPYFQEQIQEGVIEKIRSVNMVF